MSQQPAAPPIMVSTMNDLPGYRVVHVFGEVFGLIVRSRNVFSNIGAGFKSLAGGEIFGAYTKLLGDSRNEAVNRLRQSAAGFGANAILAMRFDCNEIAGSMSEVAAYGTAVYVVPLAQPAAPAQQAAPAQPAPPAQQSPTPQAPGQQGPAQQGSAQQGSAQQGSAQPAPPAHAAPVQHAPAPALPAHAAPGQPGPAATGPPAHAAPGQHPLAQAPPAHAAPGQPGPAATGPPAHAAPAHQAQLTEPIRQV